MPGAKNTQTKIKNKVTPVNQRRFRNVGQGCRTFLLALVTILSHLNRFSSAEPSGVSQN